MPMNTASYSASSCSMVTSLPTSVLRRNSMPMPLKTSRRLLSTLFSSLNSGIPKVSRPPISGFLSNTTGVTPPRTSTSAQPRPAGPAPMIATRLPVGLTLDMSGRQPMANAVSVMYFSTEPMVTAPKPSLRVQAPPAADFRQGVGLVGQFGGGEDIALGHQLQPVGNEVVHRALPFAIRVTATQAAVGLVGRLLGFEGFVDLHELFLALTQQFLLRILAPDIDELEVVTQTFSHYKNLIKLFRRISLRVRTDAGKQRFQVGSLGLDQPETTQVIIKVFSEVATPFAVGFLDVFVQHMLQVVAIGFHRFAADPLDLDQLVVDLVDEGVVLVEHVGETAGHARAEVVASLAQNRDKTTGHVFAAVIARAFNHGVGTGVTHRETLTRRTRRKQLAAGCAVQAGVADDGTVLSLVDAAFRRNDHQLAAGHALAYVVAGVTFQVHVQATGVPHTEALTRRPFEAEGDRRLGHALVAVTTGDFTGNPRADGTVAVADIQGEVRAAQVVDRRQGHLDHLLGQQALVEGRVALDLAELRLVRRDVIAAQQRRQVQVVLLGGFAFEDFQQIGTPDQFLKGAHAELGQPLTGFLGDVGEEVHHHVDGTDVRSEEHTSEL